MALLISAAVSTAMVLLVAFAALRLARLRSAARRHGILAAAILVAAAVPFLTALMPRWEVVVLAWPRPAQNHTNPAAAALAFPEAEAPAESGSVDRPVDAGLHPGALPLPDAAPLQAPAGHGATVMERPDGKAAVWLDAVGSRAPASADVLQALLLVWMAGAAYGLGAMALGILRLRRLAQRAGIVTHGPWTEHAAAVARVYGLRRSVRLLQASGLSTLATWGLWRPILLLPAGAQDWPADRIRTVLHHEFAHIRRCDWALQMAAEVQRAVYWFNPLFSIACNRMARESERACDDMAINSGIDSAEYAGHLLELAKSMKAGGQAWTPALSMAHPSTLEDRFAAILNSGADRSPITHRSMIIIALLLAGVATTAAAVQWTVQPEGAAPNAAPVMQAAPASLGEAFSESANGERQIAALGAQRAPGGLPGPQVPPPSLPAAAAWATAPIGPMVQTGASGAVTGRVRIWGTETGLADVRIALRATQGAVLNGMTDLDGRFSFREAPQGTYRVVLDRAGYLMPTGAASLSVAVDSAAVAEEITLFMMPAAAISGRVRNSMGEPLARATVRAYERSFRNGRPLFSLALSETGVRSVTGSTNERGEFRIHGLKPGEYVLWAETASAGSYRPTFYPASVHPDLAVPVFVGVGAEVGGMDIRMQSGEPLATVGGEIEISAAPILGMVTVRLVRRGVNTIVLPGMQTLTSSQRGLQFAFNQVEPGDYTLIATAMTNGNILFEGIQELTVAGDDVRVVLSVSPRDELPGILRTETGQPLPFDASPPSVVLQPIHEMYGLRPAGVNDTGTFRLPSVMRGQYRIEMTDLPPHAYVSRILYGGREAVDGIVDIAASGNTLEIVLGLDGAVVSGRITTALGAGIPWAAAVLVPNVPRRRDYQRYRHATADESGYFTIAGVAPGDYKFFAWERAIPGSYTNEAILAEYEVWGREIHIQSGARHDLTVQAVPGR